MSYEAITLPLAEHWLPQELLPSFSGLQETLLHLLCLISPPMGHFQMETGFLPALEHLDSYPCKQG